MKGMHQPPVRGDARGGQYTRTQRAVKRVGVRVHGGRARHQGRRNGAHANRGGKNKGPGAAAAPRALEGWGWIDMVGAWCRLCGWVGLATGPPNQALRGVGTNKRGLSCGAAPRAALAALEWGPARAGKCAPGPRERTAARYPSRPAPPTRAPAVPAGI